jgi:hypothetical protein
MALVYSRICSFQRVLLVSQYTLSHVVTEHSTSQLHPLYMATTLARISQHAASAETQPVLHMPPLHQCDAAIAPCLLAAHF